METAALAEPQTAKRVSVWAGSGGFAAILAITAVESIFTHRFSGVIVLPAIAAGVAAFNWGWREPSPHEVPLDRKGFLGWLLGPSLSARRRMRLPGVWVWSHNVEQDPNADDPVWSRIPRYLRRLGSDETDVPADAARYEIVVRRQLTPRTRIRLLLAAVPAALTGAWGVASGSAYAAVLGIVAGFGLTVAGAWGGEETVKFRRAASGGWVRVPVEEEPPMEQTPLIAPGWRVAAAIGAVVAFAIAFGGGDDADQVASLTAAAIGIGAAGIALADFLPIPREDPNEVLAAARRFHALADVSRPLAPRPDESAGDAEPHG